MPVYLINSAQIGISEQLYDEQKVPYSQVWLYVLCISQDCELHGKFIFAF